MIDYERDATVFKALCEPTRMRILDVLSCGERCACDILEGLSITQPTLSHHMKVLLESGLVSSRKDATWVYYAIDEAKVEEVHQLIDLLLRYKERCSCETINSSCVREMPIVVAH